MTDLQAAISKIRAKSKLVLEASEKATAGRWKADEDNCIWSVPAGIVVLTASERFGLSVGRNNSAMAALSRNFSPASAKLLLVLCEVSDQYGVEDELQEALIEMANSLEER